MNRVYSNLRPTKLTLIENEEFVESLRILLDLPRMVQGSHPGGDKRPSPSGRRAGSARPSQRTPTLVY